VISSKAKVLKVKRGDRLVSITSKRDGKFANSKSASSHIVRKLFAFNYFGVIPNHIIMAAIGHK
jgi:hypothetical protein